ncbi:sodium:proton antiporter, partial [candidate division MSBL1 archaeon SCGC-AAA259I07]
MFATIALGGALATRLNQARIPVYIITGILVGPYVLGRVGLPYVGTTTGVSYFIEMGAELGIIFLLFFLGLEFSLQRLLEHKDKIMKAGFLDLTNLIAGTVLGYFILKSLIGALLIGGIVYISSSAIIT